MAEEPKNPEPEKTTIVSKKQDVTPVRVTTPSMIVKVRNGAIDIKVKSDMHKRGKTEL